MTASNASPSRGQLLALSVLTVVAGLIIVFAFRMLFVLFAGVLFALVLRAAAEWVSRVTRLPNVAVVTALVLVGIGSSVLAGVLLLPRVGDQLETMGRDLPKAVDGLRDKFQQTPVVNHLFSADMGSRFDPKNLGKAVLIALGGSVDVVSGLVVAFFIGVYGAAQPDMYSRAALAITPKRYERHVARALRDTAHNLTRWLWGRLIAMIFVGVTTSIVFHVLHLPLALTLGVFAGLLTFIEYAGAILSAVPPLLLGFSHSSTTGLAVLSAYVVLHVVEGYVLTPLLSRASVHLPPALTLASQAILGELTGVLGLTFSTPLFVVGVSAVKAFREQQAEDSTLDRAEPKETGRVRTARSAVTR